MSRYIGPVCRLCRREGEKLFLKGERCYGPKCAIERRTQGKTTRAAKMSEYKLRLREKQKIKRFYGLMEKQFRLAFEKAAQHKGVTGDNLLTGIERRLDNVVYRMGFTTSRRESRELVLHGHFLINGKRVTYPGQQVKAGDQVQVAEKSKQIERIKQAVQLVGHRGLPGWLGMDPSRLQGEVRALPTRADITQPFREQLVIELYSK